MQIRQLHAWTVDAGEAIKLQQELSKSIVKQNLPPTLADPDSGAVRLIAGCDLSFHDNTGRAVVVILSFPDLQPLHVSQAEVELSMPYIPGLLSFREAPVYMAAFEQLPAEYIPDLLMVDGQGYAHPRRFGLASHVALLLDLPAIGCAKSRLVGRYSEPGPLPGDRAELHDQGEVIGTVLRTKVNTKPLFISIGNKIDLPTACDYVLRCCRGYRLPEPTRLAHNAAAGRDIFSLPRPKHIQQSFLDRL